MKITVLGGGNGAFAAAAHMSLLGHEVTLSNRSFSKISALEENPSLEICGGALPDKTVTIAHVEKCVETAIMSAQIILVCVPSLSLIHI